MTQRRKMITLKNDYKFENVLKKDSDEFNKFQEMILFYFNFTREIDKFKKDNTSKEFKFLNIEFIKRGIVVEVKKFLWFRDRILIHYEDIIKQIQRDIIKLNKENTIFGEAFENNNLYYYITFKDGNDIIYYKNNCKIDLYLNIYDDIFYGTNPINIKK